MLREARKELWLRFAGRSSFDTPGVSVAWTGSRHRSGVASYMHCKSLGVRCRQLPVASRHHLADNELARSKSSALDLPLPGGDVGAAVLGSIPGDSFTATPARRRKYLRPYLGPCRERRAHSSGNANRLSLLIARVRNRHVFSSYAGAGAATPHWSRRGQC